MCHTLNLWKAMKKKKKRDCRRKRLLFWNDVRSREMLHYMVFRASLLAWWALIQSWGASLWPRTTVTWKKRGGGESAPKLCNPLLNGNTFVIMMEVLLSGTVVKRKWGLSRLPGKQTEEEHQADPDVSSRPGLVRKQSAAGFSLDEEEGEGCRNPRAIFIHRVIQKQSLTISSSMYSWGEKRFILSRV